MTSKIPLGNSAHIEFNGNEFILSIDENSFRTFHISISIGAMRLLIEFAEQNGVHL